MDNNTTKYIMIGTAGLVVSAAAIWFLSRDDESEKANVFNIKFHTIEKLNALYEDFFIDGVTLYCQKLNLIRKLKSTDEFTSKILEDMKVQ